MMGRPGIGVIQAGRHPWSRPWFGRPGCWTSRPTRSTALTYGRAMDTTRFSDEAGFAPAYSSRAALEEFAAVSRPWCAQHGAGRSGAGLAGLDAEQAADAWLTRRSSSWAAEGRRAGEVGPRRPPPPAVWPPIATALRRSSTGCAAIAPRPTPAPPPEPEPDFTPPEPPPEEVPPTLSLGALLTEAAALLRQALEGIGSEELRELLADPARTGHPGPRPRGGLAWVDRRGRRVRPSAAGWGLCRRRVRIRPGVHHQGLSAAAAAAGAVLVPGGGPGRGEPTRRRVRRCWCPTTPAPCRWTG